MIIAGFQKLTLLDFPGKTACTVFTAGCDFACPFCQNASLIDMDTGFVTEGDVFDFLGSRRGLLDGVCFSGGGALLQDGLEDFIDSVKGLGFLVKLDTNGSDPVRLRRLIESGLVDYVAMDVKNSPEKYAKTIGLPEFDVSPIDESIGFLLSCNGSEYSNFSYEFRTTVVKEFHTIDDLLSIAQWIAGARTQISGNVSYFLQKFIDSDNVMQKGLHSYSDAEMQQFLYEVIKVLPTAELRGV